MFQGMNKGEFRAYGKPIVNLTVNDQKISDWRSFNVDWNGTGDVDSFDVSFQWDVSNKPRNDLFYSGAQGASELVRGKAVIKIEAGFENEELITLIEGEMDNPDWDFSSGETITLSGRSYAAKPYDFKEKVKYQNMTATEAHQKICEVHGLTSVAPVASVGLIGEYQNEDHSTVSEEMSHWDYVLYLAEQEGFVSRVKEKEWYFGPLELLPEYQKEPLSFSYGHNIRGLKLKRAPNAARELRVEVVSWQTGNKKSKGSRIVESAPPVEEKKEGEEAAGGSDYVIRRCFPNITRAQAKKQAEAILEGLMAQQFSGSFETDFFTELKNDRRILLYGVGLHLSQMYHVSQVSISAEAGSGISMSVEFTNILEK